MAKMCAGNLQKNLAVYFYFSFGHDTSYWMKQPHQEGHDVDVAVITETHLKKKLADSCVDIDNYVLFRRDRVRRKCGGVAIYSQQSVKAAVCKPPVAGDDPIVMSCSGLKPKWAVTSRLSERCITHQFPSTIRRVYWIISRRPLCAFSWTSRVLLLSGLATWTCCHTLKYRPYRHVVNRYAANSREELSGSYVRIWLPLRWH